MSFYNERSIINYFKQIMAHNLWEARIKIIFIHVSLVIEFISILEQYFRHMLAIFIYATGLLIV